MTTYNAADLLTKTVPSTDQAITLFGSVAPGANTATGDKLRPMKIPGGMRVGALLVNVRTAFGATAPAKIGFSTVDGSTPDAAIYSDPSTQMTAATDTTHATTGTKLVMPQAGAWVTPEDSYLEVLFGSVGTGASGVADYVLMGEFVGV